MGPDADAAAAARRALGFLAWFDDAMAARRVVVGSGVAVLDPRARQVWDANHLRVEPGSTPGAEAVRADADAVLGGAGLRWRQVQLLGDELEPLSRELVDAGWSLEHHVVMVRTRAADRPAEHAARVRVVDFETALGVRAAELRSLPWARPRLVEEMLGRDRRVANRVGERWFAVLEGGAAVAACRLYVRGAVAQVDDVATLASRRRRGLGRAVVDAAAATAGDEGATTVFIVAAPDDRPRLLYERLGFEVVSGIRHHHLDCR